MHGHNFMLKVGGVQLTLRHQLSWCRGEIVRSETTG